MCTCMSDNSSELGRILAVMCGDAFLYNYVCSQFRKSDAIVLLVLANIN